MPKPTPSVLVIVSAVVAILFLATAAVILSGDSDVATTRLGLLFAMFGIVIPVLLATLKSDQAASQTNGNLDQRIHDAVRAAQQSKAVEQAAAHPEIPVTRDLITPPTVTPTSPPTGN